MYPAWARVMFTDVFELVLNRDSNQLLV